MRRRDVRAARAVDGDRRIWLVVNRSEMNSLLLLKRGRQVEAKTTECRIGDFLSGACQNGEHSLGRLRGPNHKSRIITLPKTAAPRQTKRRRVMGTIRTRR